MYLSKIFLGMLFSKIKKKFDINWVKVSDNLKNKFGGKARRDESKIFLVLTCLV